MGALVESEKERKPHLESLPDNPALASGGALFIEHVNRQDRPERTMLLPEEPCLAGIFTLKGGPKKAQRNLAADISGQISWRGYF